MYKVKDYNNPSKKMFDDTGLDITYYTKKSPDSLFDLQSPRAHGYFYQEVAHVSFYMFFVIFLFILMK
jgi:hypothetical protein